MVQGDDEVESSARSKRARRVPASEWLLFQALLFPGLRRHGIRYRPRVRWNDPTVREVAGMVWPILLGSAVGKISIFVDQLLASLRATSPGAKGLLKVGVAWEQILVAAAEVRADLLVLGTHGRRGVAHAVMGSVAERVVRLSEIPVLTVRSRAAPARREGSP